MPSISVLLPVYNAIHELPRAVYSLLNQTYKDFEIIAIDDGSTDGSGELLDTFSRMDQRVHVFHGYRVPVFFEAYRRSRDPD